MEIFSEKGKVNYFVGTACIALSLFCAFMAYNAYESKKFFSGQPVKGILESQRQDGDIKPEAMAKSTYFPVESNDNTGLETNKIQEQETAPAVLSQKEASDAASENKNMQGAEIAKESEMPEEAKQAEQVAKGEETQLMDAVQEVQKTADIIVSKLMEEKKNKDAIEKKHPSPSSKEDLIAKQSKALQDIVNADRKKVAVIKKLPKKQVSDQSIPQTGTMWVDRDAQRFVVTLGIKHGMKKGDRLDVFSGAEPFSQVEVETVMDVVSYVKPIDQAVESYPLDYYQVIFNAK